VLGRPSVENEFRGGLGDGEEGLTGGEKERKMIGPRYGVLSSVGQRRRRDQVVCVV
jgi:hypothetical protein